jgi:uncharacterized delta-60 repeat protein
VPRRSLLNSISKTTSVALACALLPGAASAAPADPDPQFGSGGRVTTDFAARTDIARALAIQPDGKIIAAGVADTGTAVQYDNDFAVARYLPSGELDDSFGGDGRVTTSFDNPGLLDSVWDVALQPDGKIVAVGETTKPIVGRQFAVVRYRPDGSLDPDFSGDGRQTFGFDNLGLHDAAQAVVLDGTAIVVAGWSDQGQSSIKGAIARLTEGGALDQSFGVGGRRTFGATGTATSIDTAQDLVRQPDGRYVVVGTSHLTGDYGKASLFRFEHDGDRDTSFAGTGLTLTSFGVQADEADGVAVALQDDGKLVAAGQVGEVGASDQFAVARYLPNGQPDPSFGGDGFQTTAVSGEGETPAAAAIDASGQVLVAGRANKLATSVVVRYGGDGTLDAGFGDAGVLISTDDDPDAAGALALQPDGRIVVAGFTGDGTSTDFYLQRLQGGPMSDAVETEPLGETPRTPPPPPPTGPCASLLAGTPRADLLRGGANGDRLLGGAGNDRLSGRGGDDCLKGGRGSDRLMGGRGRDRLVGGTGLNSYRAGPGRDFVSARNGRPDSVACGTGRDRVRADRQDRLTGCELVSRAG